MTTMEEAVAAQRQIKDELRRQLGNKYDDVQSIGISADKKGEPFVRVEMGTRGLAQFVAEHLPKVESVNVQVVVRRMKSNLDTKPTPF